MNKLFIYPSVILSLVSSELLSAKDTDKQPNILFIYMDDLGWTDVASGSKYYETPNIDKLAEQSIRFTQAYSCGPNSAPSRASLLTGKYTPRHGVYTVGTSERGDSTQRKLIPIENNQTLGLNFVTIAEELQHAGYNTGLIGKWQLGSRDKGTDPTKQGFDYVISGQPGTSSYFYPYAKGKSKKELPAHFGINTGSEGEYLTDRLTDEAVRFISTKREKPFFLYLAHFAVHTPTQAKQSKIDKFKSKQGDEFHNNPVYAGMLESADEGVGKVLHALDSLKLSDNTIVVFYSDNGGYGGVTAQPPLKGAKGMLYEGGIRVPLFVKWPGKSKPGSINTTPVIGVDFYPTFLEFAGIKDPLNKEVDGLSFAPLVKQTGTIKRDAIYWHFPAYLEGSNNVNKIPDSFRTRPVSAIRSGDFKLLEFYEDSHLELYNIKNDIGEKHDLSTVQQEKLKELHEKLDTWRKSVNAPIPTQLNPDYEPQQ
jgi:arylsulfatase A-like enzyme